VIAAIGPGALLFWLLGFLLFFLPQGVAVLELSSRYPQEGGIYNWVKTAFGDFHGFLSGWCYWTNNIFYIPTLLFYIVGFAAYIGGPATAGLATHPLSMSLISLALLWVITGINVLGLDVGKWVQSIGAVGTLLTTAVILAVGLITLSMQGAANTIDVPSVFSGFNDWRTVALLSVVCLNYVGLELGSVLGDEIKEPRRSIPRAVVIAGVTTVTLYLLATFALQLTIPSGEIGVIDGILQGVQRAATSIHLPWIVIPVALLMSLNAAGNTSAWLAGSSRIPFVIGIDRYLPAALGRTHPRYHTPHVALVVQGFASSLFIVISAIGSSVHDMYMILLQTTVILQLIPYLYMFAALIRLRLRITVADAERRFFRNSWSVYAAGVLGFLVTAGALFVAFIPSASVTDVWNFELKTTLGTLSFLIPALVLFRMRLRKDRFSATVPQEIEVVPD
jgi:amino acid transporter